MRPCCGGCSLGDATIRGGGPRTRLPGCCPNRGGLGRCDRVPGVGRQLGQLVLSSLGLGLVDEHVEHLRPLCLADAELVADRGRSGCGVFPALSCDAEGDVVVGVEHGGSVAGGADRKLGAEGACASSPQGGARTGWGRWVAVVVAGHNPGVERRTAWESTLGARRLINNYY